MGSYLVLTAMGEDRTGLVDDISARLYEKHLNIESSRMAVLAGEFAMIMVASGNESDIEAVVRDREELFSGIGLTIHVKKSEGLPEGPARPALGFHLIASGMDHPNVVHEISSILHLYRVNLESLETRVHPAPVSGAPVFSMDAMVSVPAEVRIRRLKNDLVELGDEMNMDIEMFPRENK
ncbi:MAG: ACT domain-containing protein [bacterium]